jgi:hypothetical protein
MARIAAEGDAMQIEVRSRIPGDDGLPAVLIELAEETTTTRELIRRAVIEQVNVTKADAARSRAMLDRQYLTPEEVRAQAGTGTVRIPAAVDGEAEIERALRAFVRGAFVVFCGGRQVETLDEVITLKLGEPVLFLRLVPLVGG